MLDLPDDMPVNVRWTQLFKDWDKVLEIAQEGLIKADQYMVLSY